MSVGVKVGEEVRILPFSKRYPIFSSIEQELTPTSVVFHCREPELGIKATISFVSPFYPQDEKVCMAPFYYIDVTVENIGVPKLIGDASLSEAASLQGELFIQIEQGEWRPERMNEKFPSESFDHSGFRFPVEMSVDPTVARRKWLNKTKGKAFSSSSFKGEMGLFPVHADQARVEDHHIFTSFEIAEKQTQSLNLIFAGYADQPVMQVEKDMFSFKYTTMFKDLSEVIDYAKKDRDQMVGKCDLTDQLIINSSLDKSAVQLNSFSLQSFLSNTWWMSDQQESEWFTVWEGNCAYHSTIDVEYNTSLFYLMLWPELLEMTIKQWTDYEKSPGFMSHDIGKFLVGEGMEYGHEMEIEENCNFILLLHALRKFSGKTALLESIYPQIVRLIQYVANSDTTGNGFPNEGTANTIDDAGAAVQYSKEQTYLGIKSYSAFLAVKELAEQMMDMETIQLCESKMNQIRDTLDEKAWLGDHYAVCIHSSAEGIKDVWTGEQMTGEIPGWDAYSIYPTNGLLYLLMTGTEVQLDKERLRTNLITATEKSMTRYGCKHSSHDTTDNLWISQNMWKDMTSAYLGLDMLGYSSHYWDYELFENTQGIGGCFVDAPPKAHLNYYPRGIASIGMLYAMAGVQVDHTKGQISINPVRVPCRVPLLNLADWVNGIVPWIDCSLREGRIVVKLENKQLFDGWNVWFQEKNIK